MNIEFPCKCSHPRQWHERILPHDEVDCCLRCSSEARSKGRLPTYNSEVYHDYAPDNLRYLEIKNANKEIQNNSLQNV